MSRPMLLMKEDLLKIIYEKRGMQVPLTKLIEQHKLHITHPTLARMIKQYDMLHDPYVVHTLIPIIRASLFPEWLTSERGVVVSQPNDWYYTGIFPLGEWRRR